MRVENTTTGHARVLRFTDIDPRGLMARTALRELTVTVHYVTDDGDGDRVNKAITLDNYVIPAIIRAVNEGS